DDAHRAGGAGDRAGGLLHVEGVHVRELLLGDLLAVGHRELLADLVLVRLARALLGAGGLGQQDAGRAALDLERERSVLEGRDQRYAYLALHSGRLGVELLDELARVHAVLAERRADRRGGRGGAALSADLELSDNFLLSHASPNHFRDRACEKSSRAV